MKRLKKGEVVMKRFICMGIILGFASTNMIALKRFCSSVTYSEPSKNYDYIFSYFAPAMDDEVMCEVTFTPTEKQFIQKIIMQFPPRTVITRDFYVNNIKGQYSYDQVRGQRKKNYLALRRVMRDFGGSKKYTAFGGKNLTIQDINNMLQGNLKEIYLNK